VAKSGVMGGGSPKAISEGVRVLDQPAITKEINSYFYCTLRKRERAKHIHLYCLNTTERTSQRVPPLIRIGGGREAAGGLDYRKSVPRASTARSRQKPQKKRPPIGGS